jgi:hypothetical protein
MNPKQLKFIGLIAGIIAIANLVLFAFVQTNWIVFWGVLLVLFAFLKWGLPRLKSNS